MTDTLLSLLFRFCAATLAAFLCLGVPAVLWTLVTGSRRTAVERAYVGVAFALGFAGFILAMNGLMGLFIEAEGLRRGVLLGVMGIVATVLFVVAFVASRSPNQPLRWVSMLVGFLAGTLATSYFASTELTAGPIRSAVPVVAGLLVLFLVTAPLALRAQREREAHRPPESSVVRR